MNQFNHQVDIQVRFNDVDMLGHVSNTVYPSFYDCGKQKYIESILGNLQWGELSIVGASTKIDHLKPILMHTEIAVQTRIAKVGNKSITFEQRIINKENNDVLSTCTAVVVCYKPLQRESVSVPDGWREKIETFENNS